MDTTFARFVPCNCLTPTPIVIDGMGLGTVKYDVVQVSDGKKVGEGSDIDVVSKNIATNGYKNNTIHNIYIKAYRKFHYNTRNVDEYFDESFVVRPGEETLGNYRSWPEAGTVLQSYISESIVYLGQYVDKGNDVNCKIWLKSKK